MKTSTFFTTLLAVLLGFQSFAQTQFWSDDFEDAGAPSSGTRTPSEQFSCGSPATNYFFRTDVASIALQSGTYSGYEGSKVWAGEDLDFGPTCVNASVTPNQQVTWSSINISGKSGLSFTGSFAANSSFASNWEGSNYAPNQDFVAVEYRIDGGAWTKIIAFYATAITQSQTLNLDSNGDLIGDGAALTYAFGDFSASIPGTGTTLDIRLNVSANGSATEEFAVDNFRLFETPSCTAPTITANPPNRAICNGNNTTFSINATGATAYQWQVDTGSGFNDISNGGVYSNATTNILTITGATSGMNGYQYRCVAINGTLSCTTNSSAGTLTISSISTAAGSQTNVSCNGGSNGAASITPSGGISPYTYSWSPSGGTGAIATSLSAGSYTVTVTDNIGCTATRNYTITQPPALTVTPLSQTNISCNGGSNGAASVTASGGASGYTYNWTPGNPTGDGTAAVTGLSAGTWTCTVTDANACTASVNFTVTQPTAISLTPSSQTNIACNGGSTGAAAVNAATGGAGGYTYNWTPGNPTGDGTTSITGLSAGTWTCTVTDANACTASVNFTVTQPTAISLTPSSQTNIACNGGSTGAAAVNAATGGAGGYTYNWTPGNPTGDGTTFVTGLSAGTWTCTVTDANACTASVNFTVTQPPALTVSPLSQTNISCNGGSNGAASVTASGGASGYIYNWTPGNPTGDGTTSITGLSAGTWTCTVTDANACTASVNFTVTQPTAISLTAASQTNISCNGGSNGAAAVNTATGGAGGYTYDWTPGNPTGDGTTSVTGLSAGTWTCTVTDANACTASVNFTVTQPTAISLTAASQTNISCNGGSNGAAAVNTATGGAGGYTYDWTPGNPTGDGTTSVTGLSAGTWTCTVTDANACTASVNFTVTQPTAISLTAASQTNISCNGGSNGAAAVNAAAGGAGGYTYDWTPGNPTGDGTAAVTGLSAGTWTCTVTDANACTASVNFTITQPTALTASATGTDVSCNGGANGTATTAVSGGATPYTYSWAPSGGTNATATGLAAGTYTVTVTDNNACQTTASVTINEPTALTASATGTDVSCNGGANGTATTTVSGGATPYAYSWAPSGGTNATATGLAAGTYTVTVTDNNACQTTASVTINEPTALTASATGTDVSCNGGANGTATTTVSGGATPYAYSWAPSGGTNATATGLAAGTYTVTVTDNNACQTTASVTINEPTALTASATGTDVSCNGGANGTATTTVSGGATPYAYSWAPSGGTNATATGLAAGTYTVTVTDNNACQTTASVTINEPTALTASATGTDVSCNGGANGTATTTVSGGATPYAYSWAPSGGTNATATGLAAGTYTVTVTDNNACQTTASVTINEPTALTASATGTDVSCNGGANGTATTTVSGGATPYAYSWAPSGGTNATATGLAAGTYTVTVTDNNACQTTASVTINEPAPIVGSESVTICESYTWTADGQTYMTSGTYTATLTAINGCDSTATLNLVILQPSQSDTFAIVCDSFHWNQTGVDYTTGGLYQNTLVNAVGCDSIVMLHLTVNNSFQSTQTATACGSYTWSVNGNTYNTSGQYSEVLSTSNGCDSTLILDLTINQPSTGVDNVTSCDAYTWIDGNTYSTSTNTPTFVLTNAAGCDSVVTLNLTISPLVISAINNNNTLVASGGTSYQWIVCGVGLPISNATSATFTPGANGQYACIVSNGVCSDTTDCVSVTTLGINELSNSSISVYPNPATASVHVNWSGSAPANVVLYDAQGKLVLTQTLYVSGETIAVDQFERGVYLINISSGEQTLIQRLVKQ